MFVSYTSRTAAMCQECAEMQRLSAPVGVRQVEAASASAYSRSCSSRSYCAVGAPARPSISHRSSRRQRARLTRRTFGVRRSARGVTQRRRRSLSGHPGSGRRRRQDARPLRPQMRAELVEIEVTIRVEQGGLDDDGVGGDRCGLRLSHRSGHSTPASDGTSASPGVPRGLSQRSPRGGVGLRDFAPAATSREAEAGIRTPDPLLTRQAL
jgi:hypothetical protein